jgi:hypothetical protein
LSDFLSGLILQAGYIIDILTEVSKSVAYGIKHIDKIQAAGDLFKSDKSIDVQVCTRTPIYYAISNTHY